QRGHPLKELTPIPASLQHVVFVPTKEGKKFPTIIAVHGRGTDENDLIPLVLELERTNITIISPRAPFPFPGGGFTWYDIIQEVTPNPKTFDVSLGLFRKFIDETMAAYPVDPDKLLLLGFSQGTVMSYSTALLHPESFRAVIALSGYIPLRSGLKFETSKLANFPFFISHGTYDQMIPLKYGQESVQFLKDAGAQVTYHEYSMAHEVRQETMRDLKNWLEQAL
ncbi:MAG TPA: alpha/beta hydrolase-fold protein, partial [Terriglobales bacterium]|nr:alpha/beta hydrolase-fold protein [Terriglobales bacterium]